MERSSASKLLLIGLLAGIAAGLFGIGGGLVMVPLLVIVCGFGQHRAHVNSLSAGMILATAGAVTYAVDGSVDFGVASALAVGGIIGAPLGARVMSRISEARLKAAFGALILVLAVVLFVQ